MDTITLLHTNDIHGRTEALARVATLIEALRARHPAGSMLYVDCGDVEDFVNRLSNLTRGVALHRLLDRMDCAACVVGNAACVRYGPDTLRAQAAVVRYPLLMGNYVTLDGQPIPGTQAAQLVPVGERRIGLIGVTARYEVYERFFGLWAIPAVDVVREQAAVLRAQGADAVIVLSHLGIDADRELAAVVRARSTRSSAGTATVCCRRVSASGTC